MSAFDWQDDAACRGYDPELFFSDGKNPEDQERTRIAKAICVDCPVRKQCRTVALSPPRFEGHQWTAFGVWGGETKEERDVVTALGVNAKCRNASCFNRVRTRLSWYCLPCHLSSRREAQRDYDRTKRIRIREAEAA